LQLKEIAVILSFVISPRPAQDLDRAAILTKAALRAADALGLTRAELASILGISAASASRLGRARRVEPGSKEGELALLFLRVFRSLDGFFSGNLDAARVWLHAPNDHVGGRPAELLCRVEGLVRVAAYLDAMRAKS
jgi:hypothetical protein